MGSSSALASQLGFKIDRALKPGETLELFRLWREEGEDYRRDEIVEGNLPLVVAISKGLYRKALDASFYDVFADGCVGLMSAVDKFDLAKGCMFSTYASYWIKQAIRRARQNNKLIHIPNYLQRSNLEEKYELRFADAARAVVFSDCSESKHHDSTCSEGFDPMIPDGRIDADRVEQVEVGARLILDSLGEADRMVLCLRLGLEGHEPLRLIDLAPMLGVKSGTAVSGRLEAATGRARRRLASRREEFADAI